MFYLFNLSEHKSIECKSDGLPALVVVLLTALALGSNSALALNEDADKPIQIRSDELVYEDKASRATYTGDVEVNQGSLKITAEKVTIEFEDDKVIRLIAAGSPAYYSQQLKADQENMQADARTIIYHTRDEKVDLKGDAHLSQEGNDFRGELIEYDIRAGRVDAASEKPDRIRMTLQPKKRSSDKSVAEPES